MRDWFDEPCCIPAVCRLEKQLMQAGVPLAVENRLQLGLFAVQQGISQQICCDVWSKRGSGLNTAGTLFNPERFARHQH